MRKQLVRKAFNLFYQVISTAVIVLGVLLGVLYLCGIRLYHVKSGSMGELLPVGCVCFVNTYSDFDEIAVNDVISFRANDDILVTHRAVRITADGIITQGDENDSPDPNPVTKENYIGRIVFAVPYVGAILNALHTKTGIITAAAIIVLLFVWGFVFNSKGSESS